MNKKLIIPIVLCAIIIIAIASSIISGGGKIKLTWTPVPIDENGEDSIELKVYVENSGSMNAYMCAGSNLKDAVFDYVSDLKRCATSCSLYYINSRIIPYDGDLNSFIKDLTPQSFANAGGNTTDTDLMQIFKMIMENQSSKTVSVFVSDCILDISGNALDLFGRCQVSIKNVFNDAIAMNPYLGVEIIQLESEVDGYWFCGKNREYLKDVKRPYYIWVIGDQRLLGRFNEKVPVEDIIGGIKEYCAYATSQPIPFDVEQSTYTVNHARKINVQLLVNLNGSLQKNETKKDATQYKVANPSQVSIVSIDDISDKTSPYSHVLELEIENPNALRSESITFSYPYLATWVADSDDATGQNVKDNLDKTTGLMPLIKGVAEAYKSYMEYGSISFELKNN